MNSDLGKWTCTWCYQHSLPKHSP